ncbi:MAG: LysR family transcriptional regulator [Rhodocyclaceae bacterium]|nr:LysR family transcriptional regulator [Rhodocyclaceae bacterium]MBK6552511.1 LysR family transcriptional regulator [Rhodocyclaceae bacterium]MBK6675564.1 LysR family transcriptional regulator [Rhodocyclaceae bacterium]MBK7814259.1 LysR family transcriptional regulator [Rhodocyclaceae bacterium]MBK9312047.1 LysR family transcriptional regulator [Rhodocyclaceae bacterium]
MRRKIPGTFALVAFTTAARHESFTKAAHELSLSQSAVCRQISGLEDFLRVKLFRRTRQGVRLTEAGMLYGRQVAKQLDAVERDTLAIMAHQGGGLTIDLAVVPTFATKWLLPRLGGFLARHVGVQVNFETRTRPFLFDDTEFDAAIHFGNAGWPGTQACFLMWEQSVPVCSPAVLASRPVIEPGVIAELPLLQQSTRPYAWRQWFASLNMEVARDMSGPRFELFSMLAEAAIQGMGVALIPAMLIEDELASGKLVVACDRSCRSEKAYYLIYPEHKSETTGFRSFRTWLCDEATRYREASGL